MMIRDGRCLRCRYGGLESPHEHLRECSDDHQFCRWRWGGKLGILDSREGRTIEE